MAPLKYQLCPSQGIREPAPSGPVVIRPWDGDVAEIAASAGFAGGAGWAAGFAAWAGFAGAPA